MLKRLLDKRVDIMLPDGNDKSSNDRRYHVIEGRKYHVDDIRVW